MSSAADRYDLARFLQAQADVYEQALRELRAGAKRSHWMWFIFPQVAGLGFSAMSQRYAIGGLDEARAYLQHPQLGARLRECTQAVHQLAGRTARQIFGSPDDMKFRSCMTLFALAAESDSVFSAVLRQYFAGQADEQTLQRVGSAAR